MPSFLETILKGLNALRALNPRKKLTFTLLKESRIQLRIEKDTIVTSKILNESLRQVPFPKTNPRTMILQHASAIKIPEIILTNKFIELIQYGSVNAG